MRQDQVLQNSQAERLALTLEHEQNFISLRLDQEDTTLRDILAYAELQTVTGGRWSWLGSMNSGSAQVSSVEPAKAATP